MSAKHFFPYDSIVPQDMGNQSVRRVLAYEEDAMCVENQFEQGAVSPVHSHPHTQITYVVEGVFEFTVGDQTYTIRKGDTLIKQNGIEHGCVCLEKGVLLDFFTPMRKEFV